MLVSPAIPLRLYHYTCGDHGRAGIEATKVVRPFPQPLLRANLAWFTDMETPCRWSLGLTKATLCCDRTEFRVSVNTKDTEILPWWHWCHNVVPGVIREMYELDGLHLHWWVSEKPVIAQEIVESKTLYAKPKAEQSP